MMKPRRALKKLNAEELWEFALKSLDRRAYAALELRKRLAAKAESGAAVSAVMAKLAEYGLLDDRKFAESFASARLDSQGLGARRVLNDLRARSVPAQVAEQVVAKVYGETDEIEMAARYLARKFRSKNLPDFLAEEKNLAAAYRRLRTAGFGASASIRVLKRFAARADELADSEPEAEPDSGETPPF